MKRNNVYRLLMPVLLVAFANCKKNDAPMTPERMSEAALSAARDKYLWYDKIPADFNARNYSDPNKVMEAVRAFSTAPGFAVAVDRWSFAMLRNDWDKFSTGIGSDFGLDVFFLNNNDLRVAVAEPASPAGKAGIRRGWRIKQFNGGIDISPDNVAAISQALHENNTGSFVFERPNNTDTAITLRAANYQERAILFDAVYANGGKPTGYMVFNSLLGDTNEIKKEFTRVFNKFSNNQVQDVVIDLRYNGGGYVSLQSVLADYLVPVAGDKGVMSKQVFNNKYTADNITSYFSKKGNLNLKRIFFIVSSGTASASELLINCLKPYMEVQLIGPTPTHGKPIGFAYAVPVADWYVFPASIRVVNKNDEGDYYNGLALNYQVADGLDKDWGDVNESCLQSALRYISRGNYARMAVTPAQRAGLTGEVLRSNAQLGAGKGKVMINR